MRAVVIWFLVLAWPTAALAHGSERGFVLLLPTGHMIVGGSATVALTFILMALLPGRAALKPFEWRLPFATLRAPDPMIPSLLAALFLAFIITAGFLGSRDPLANPLPLTIWTIWWIGVTLAHAVFGPLWTWINPWSGPYRLLDAALGHRLSRAPPLTWPRWLGAWPAIGLFVAFAWFELIDPAPDDPDRLAVAVTIYWTIAFLGVCLFGETVWFSRAEPFSLFFRFVSALSPFIAERVGDEARPRWRVALALPGAGLVARPPVELAQTFFLIGALATVSFDALSKTFTWLSLGNVNPLEFPGRTEMIPQNTAGLLIAVAVLALVYVVTVRLGWELAGRPEPLDHALGAFVHAILPISMGFHLSHYLTALLVDSQYALAAASDPFGTGADWFGTRDIYVVTSFLSTLDGVSLIWFVQTGAVVIGHILAVVVAHAIAVKRYGDAAIATRTQAPLAIGMVGYTLFGLWLLSTPIAG